MKGCRCRIIGRAGRYRGEVCPVLICIHRAVLSCCDTHGGQLHNYTSQESALTKFGRVLLPTWPSAPL